MTRQDILKVWPKLSDMLQAMHDGLDQLPGAGKFDVHMSSYGYMHLDKVCYGCAATAAIWWGFGESYVQPHRPPDGIANCALLRVEMIIDNLRSGDPSDVLSYYELDITHIPNDAYTILLKLLLTDTTYKARLPLVAQVITILKEANL